MSEDTISQDTQSDFEAFKEHRRRFSRSDGGFREEVSNAALGLVGETGELAELVGITLALASKSGKLADKVKKELYHDVFADREKLLSEIGDVLFYLDWLAERSGVTLEEAVRYNKKKLNARYPDGFVKGGGIRDE